MPFIKAEVSCPLSPNQEKELKAGMGKIILTAFTDPMMGLSYESEPIMDRLHKEYGDVVEFRNVMGLLVRDVSDFMTPEERSSEPEKGISLYCKRLARIYKSEEFIGGLPDGSAETALIEDLAFAHRLGIHSLPAYLIQYKDKALLMQSFEYQDFVAAITKLMK